jgi:transcriptional repressor NrdR
MHCPYCNSIDTKVIDSRLNQTGDITRRRRLCPGCEGRFTTYERVEEVMPLLIKKDGRREPYVRDKVMAGLKKACQKRPVTTQQLEQLIGRTEKRIQSLGLKEVPARSIGEMLMHELHAIDSVAYVRFASVYREFKDVNQFVAELKDVPASSEDSNALTFPFASQTPESTS